MGAKEDTLKDLCQMATNQVRDLYPELEMLFIPHTNGSFQEVIDAGEHGATGHPAAKAAMSIFEKHGRRELSSFLGMAIERQRKWFGLSSQNYLLGLCNINHDEFKSTKDAQRGIYHITWHAIDLAEVRKRPEYSGKFRSGPMIPKRSPLNMARLNLQADVFAAVMSGLLGEEESIDVLAKQRAIDSLKPINARRAEDYPFVIAVEAAKHAYKKLIAINPPRNKYMFYARQLALAVGQAFDDESIKQWWSFSEPAQDMAWRSFAQDIILGCAVNASEDPFVRATGLLVSELSHIEPVSSMFLSSAYNAFLNAERNKSLHREMIEKTFEEAIAKGAAEESGQPLLVAANQQNEELAEGRILGWCANALQAAGRAFENALSSGVSPELAARLEFEGNKDTSNWDSLRKIGDDIIDQKRKGFGTTLGTVAEICSQNAIFSPILNSIKVTMKSPEFMQKLAAANDLSLAKATPAPAGPAPKSPAPVTPSVAPTMAGPAAPGLGGNASTRNRMAMEQMRRQQQKDSDTGGGGEDRTQ
jgi:hypothetical protein